MLTGHADMESALEGMRFGFFFFAEYVNVFILSALTVTLFLGGYHHGIDIDPRAVQIAASRHQPTPQIRLPFFFRVLPLPARLPAKDHVRAEHQVLIEGVGDLAGQLIGLEPVAVVLQIPLQAPVDRRF